MSLRLFWTVVALVGFIRVSSVLSAQQARTPPTLDQILERLEANLNHYDSGVPSFFCDEHVVSQVMPGRGQETVTDSVFRLKRTASADHTSTLVESREIKKVNGKPATSQDIKGPSLLSGAFEGGLDIVSLNQRGCMKYALQPIDAKRPNEPYIVGFATALTAENFSECLLQEKSSGRVIIDPASMQITRLELTTPHHVIVRRTVWAEPVIGKRELTVDYAPVELGGETFWMPSAITSRDTSKGGFDATVWTFRATYRNYHRLEVKSRILPGGETVQ